jgi:hypothetical protein
MKKIFLVFLIAVLSLTSFSYFNLYEPKVLNNGQGSLGLGTNSIFRYGILNVMEVGLSPIPYVKIGMNAGDLWGSVGYAQFYESMLFLSVGKYNENSTFYLTGMYVEDAWVHDENKKQEIAVLPVIELKREDPIGNIKLFGGYNYNLSDKTHRGFTAVQVGSYFDFNWWKFKDVYLYGGLGVNIPFKGLTDSIIILAGFDTYFNFFD